MRLEGPDAVPSIDIIHQNTSTINEDCTLIQRAHRLCLARIERLTAPRASHSFSRLEVATSTTITLSAQNNTTNAKTVKRYVRKLSHRLPA